jgi:hypothetical protein
MESVDNAIKFLETIYIHKDKLNFLLEGGYPYANIVLQIYLDMNYTKIYESFYKDLLEYLKTLEIEECHMDYILQLAYNTVNSYDITRELCKSLVAKEFRLPDYLMEFLTTTNKLTIVPKFSSSYINELVSVKKLSKRVTDLECHRSCLLTELNQACSQISQLNSKNYLTKRIKLLNEQNTKLQNEIKKLEELLSKTYEIIEL